MEDKTPTASEQKNHYHLFSIMVIYMEGTKERRQFLNAINSSIHPYVSTMDLARAQREVQVRFQKTFDPAKRCVLKDLYVQSVSYLGHMTFDEFDSGFSKVVQPEQVETVEDDTTPPEDQA